MARRLKLFEISVAVVAVIGFALHAIAVLFLAVFLYGVIAGVFGPIKYGILLDHLKREELTAGNALVEGGTFIAILIGTIVAGFAVGGSRRIRRCRARHHLRFEVGGLGSRQDTFVENALRRS